MLDRIDSKTILSGLLASPVRHSGSPTIYNAAFAHLGMNQCYLCFEVDLSNLKEAIAAVRTLGMMGANLSMPNKTEAVQYMDRLSPAARMIGAINTIINRDGALEGHNTDGIGFFDNLRQHGVEVRGKTVTLVGVGGAGGAVAVQAALDGARELCIFNKRDAFWENGEALVERITAGTQVPVKLLDVDDRETFREKTAGSDIFINATNVGMKGKLEGLSLLEDASWLQPRQVVADCIYHPAKTRLLKIAEEAGCKAINGDGMLLFQAAANFKLWTGTDLPLEVCRMALAEAR